MSKPSFGETVDTKSVELVSFENSICKAKKNQVSNFFTLRFSWLRIQDDESKKQILNCKSNFLSKDLFFDLTLLATQQLFK